MVLLAVGLSPREAHPSGSGMGTITETYFEISGDDQLRINFVDPRDEGRYHGGRRDEIADALRPLAGRIKSLLDRLRKKDPWSRLLRPYRAGSEQEPDVDLEKFEDPHHASYLPSGPYRYATSFWHSPKGSHFPLQGLSVTVRFRFQGSVDLESLYELEDALRDLRSVLPGDPHDRANPESIKIQASGCKGFGKELDDELEKIRMAFTDKLQEAKLRLQGPEHERRPFHAELQYSQCRVTVDLTLGGFHQWGRAKAALIEAAQSVFKHAYEWPMPEHSVNLLPWKIYAPLR
jgi:hypothetical protein